MHYGPPPEPSPVPSGRSTPASEWQRRLSDPPTSWDSRNSWGPSESVGRGEQLAPLHFGDGPPWSEDEDLQSPVVVSSRHKKHKSSGAALGRGRSRGRRDDYDQGSAGQDYGQRRSLYGNHGQERYYMDDGGEVNYRASQGGRSSMQYVTNQRESQYSNSVLPSHVYADRNDPDTYDSDDSSPGMTRQDESRYSRDYQFAIASPDEEMHGKAVALFDFERENENELPLVEGQIIWVSYRHGQGWLVAEDPKTQESGLVPEEYVRLLRDIQGGFDSLLDEGTTDTEAIVSPVGGSNDIGTPTQADHPAKHGHKESNGNNGYQQPVISTFSTSSKDLDPYPQHLLGTPTGQQKPQVVHYHGQRGGSQANTPTVATSVETSDKSPERGQSSQESHGLGIEHSALEGNQKSSVDNEHSDEDEDEASEEEEGDSDDDNSDGHSPTNQRPAS